MQAPRASVEAVVLVGGNMVQGLPDRAQVVIVGGGIVGCSIAYHLTKLGGFDVVLLERDQLTSGTTWHAAGLVGQLRPSRNLTRLASYSVELYPKLEAETGQATGFKQNGAITVAQTEGRFIELRRAASMANAFGVEVEVLTPADVARLHPVTEVSDLVGAVFMPKDGQTNPTDTATALAKGARMGGAKVIERCPVRHIEMSGKRAAAVVTDSGRIACETLVLAGGMWTRDLAASIGVTVPLHAAEHMYIVTEPMDGVPADLPVLRDYDACIYVKEDAGKLLVGGFEPVAKPWATGGVPDDASFTVLPEDWDHFEVLMAGGLKRIPSLASAGIRQFFNGPESFTPDNRYHMGRVPECDNVYVAAGLNSIGIASAPGIGQALAQWIVDGEAPMDLWDVDASRVEPFQKSRWYLRDRTVEALGLMYAMHWPDRQPETARGARRLPYHDRLLEAGAVMGVASGWERPMFYAQGNEARAYDYSYGRACWHEAAEREAHATRNAVAIYDLTPFAKFEVQGADAEAELQRLCANDVAVEPGRAVYTQLLNSRGGIEADLTVTRLGDERFLVVTGSTTRLHDWDWMTRNLTPGARIAMTDVTSAFAVLGVMGPKSRDLLASLTDADLCGQAFPFGTSREFELGYANVRGQRVSYVGELGWELYVPVEFAAHVYETLTEAGKNYGLRHAGLHCQDCLRLEKGFKHWGHDIGPEDTPLEAGLGFAVAWDKNVAFIGRDALRAHRDRGLDRRLAMFLVDGAPRLLHEEPIWRDGKLVGTTTSGGYAFCVGKPMSMGYVEMDGETVSRDVVLAGHYEIEVAGERFPAEVTLAAPFDPKGERMRG